jgi:hypothetical protein
MTDQHGSPQKGLGIAVFSVSVASLALEVLQMRLFAFSLWHHLAFLVVSIAILGFGAAGAVLSSSRFLRARNLRNSLSTSLILFSLTALIGPYVLSQHPVDLFGSMGTGDVAIVGLYYVLFALPYFFAGYVIALALTRATEKVNYLYFLNLLGSGVGCFLIYPILGPLGALGSLSLIAMIGALPAPILILGKRAKILSSGFAFSLLLFSLFTGIGGWAPLRFEAAGSKFMNTYLRQFEAWLKADYKKKGIAFSEEQIKKEAREKGVRATEWTPLARIDILVDTSVGSKNGVGACLFQDGDAPGQMPEKGWVPPPGQIHAIAYEVKKAPKVLVIGIGGGLDIKVGLERGAKDLTGVEINKTTLDLYENKFADLVGHLAEEPNVHLFNAEGRHFVRSRKDKYDLIQMSGVDTYTALASGSYVLSESYLYTKEAFSDYLDHLNEDGIFTMVRFAFPAPRETLRVMVIAMEVLRERGAKNPWEHVVLVRNQDKAEATTLGAILVKRTPFTKEELDGLRAFSRKNGYSRDYFPDEKGDNPFHTWADSFATGESEAFLANYPYNVRPVVDDRPFFFNQHRWSSVFSFFASSFAGRGEKQNLPKDLPWVALLPDFQNKPVDLLNLVYTLGQLAILVGICIFVPLLFLKRRSKGLPAGVGAPMGYFLCLGFAYIFLMISAMQRFGLFLGHPTYAVSIVMATFLIGSGLGSLASSWIPVKKGGVLLSIVALFLVSWSIFLDVSLSSIARENLGTPFYIRTLWTVGLLAPMAFFMGSCFPMGIRVLNQGRHSLIPWAYGINGAASVLGSVLAVVLAMGLGFSNVQWVSASLYILAAFFFFRMWRKGNPSMEVSETLAESGQSNPQ